MTWQLSLASCAAANLKPGLPPTPDPTADASVELDASRLDIDYALSNDNRTVQNNGANGRTRSTMTEKAIRPGEGLIYWEWVVDAVGANSGNNHLLGVKAEFLNEATSLATFVYHCGVMVTSSATTANLAKSDSNTSVNLLPNGTVPVISAGTVYMFAVDAGKGEVYFGRNGVWISCDPEAGIPVTTIDPGFMWYPFCTPRDNGDQYTLNSIPAQFAHTMPSTARALGSDVTNFNYHPLDIRNPFFTSVTNGGGQALGWVEDPLGTRGSSISFSQGMSTGSDGRMAAFLPSHFSEGSRYSVVGGNAGRDFIGWHQDLSIDPRFYDLIDGDNYRLLSRLWVGARGVTPRPFSRVKITFLDASDNPIGSTIESAEFRGYPSSIVIGELWCDVPPSTRKVRFYIYVGKVLSETFSATRNSVTMCTATLCRKLDLMRVTQARGLYVIIKP